MPNLLHHYEYFGTSNNTISADEKRAGMTSNFPAVVEKEDAPPLYDDEPETETIAKFEEPLQLVVEGQGIVAVQVTPGAMFSIILTPSAELGENETGLKLELTATSAKFFAVTSEASREIRSATPKGPRAAFLVPGVEDLYWLSIDKKNGILRYGRTYRSASVTYLAAKVNVGDRATRAGPFIWIKSLKYISIVSLTGSSSIRPDLGQVSVGSLPIVSDLPPIIAESVDVTLEDLAVGAVTSIANLSPECQRLYANVTGPGVTLDDDNFPDFSQALEYSIRTPGKICFERLKEKAGEFGNPAMTYLRITLGYDEGNSPGVPFVIEIWPSKHKSPIHDHGEAFAVIKVLHGEINASYFTKLDKQSGIKIEPDLTFEKDEVTWIGPDNYQVHQLHNDSDRVCVTIQCYQYASEDRAHDEYFEFLEATTGEKKPFYPDSDWDFVAFKHMIKEEWEAHLKEPEWK